MEAIVLVGGRGTRLRSVVSEVPKPMAPINGRPFLLYLLDDLILKGVVKIILAVGYKKEFIKQFLGTSYRGRELVYSEEEFPLLTGGAIKKALSYCNGENVFIFNGDSFFDIDIQKMLAFMKKKKASAIVAGVKQKQTNRFGLLETDGSGRILSFSEKKVKKEGIINAGVYLINKNLLNKTTKQVFSFETEILESLVKKELFFAYIENSYFIDIGIPEDFQKSQKDFKLRTSLSRSEINI